MKTNKFLIASIVSAGFLCPIYAMAGPLLTGTQMQTFNFNTLDQSTTLNFNGFNSTLGTLNSVHFVWTINETLDSVVFNSKLTMKSVSNVYATSTTLFTGSGVATLLTSSDFLTTSPFTGNVAPGSTVVASTSATHSGDVCLSNDGSCGTGNTNLSSYIGSINLFDIAITNSGNQGGTVPGGVFTGNDGTANGTVSLFYDYSLIPASSGSVPEPTSLILMGVGLAYITTVRKKMIFPTATFA